MLAHCPFLSNDLRLYLKSILDHVGPVAVHWISDLVEYKDSFREQLLSEAKFYKLPSYNEKPSYLYRTDESLKTTLIMDDDQYEKLFYKKVKEESFAREIYIVPFRIQTILGIFITDRIEDILFLDNSAKISASLWKSIDETSSVLKVISLSTERCEHHPLVIINHFQHELIMYGNLTIQMANFPLFYLPEFSDLLKNQVIAPSALLFENAKSCTTTLMIAPPSALGKFFCSIGKLPISNNILIRSTSPLIFSLEAKKVKTSSLTKALFIEPHALPTENEFQLFYREDSYYFNCPVKRDGDLCFDHNEIQEIELDASGKEWRHDDQTPFAKAPLVTKLLASFKALAPPLREDEGVEINRVIILDADLVSPVKFERFEEGVAAGLLDVGGHTFFKSVCKNEILREALFEKSEFYVMPVQATIEMILNPSVCEFNKWDYLKRKSAAASRMLNDRSLVLNSAIKVALSQMLNQN